MHLGCCWRRSCSCHAFRDGSYVRFPRKHAQRVGSLRGASPSNYQVGPRGKKAIRELSKEPSEPWPPISAEERAQFEKEIENRSNLTWHYDSYPLVAVTMLSDVSTMVGGETALIQGDGAVRKIQGPSLGMTFLSKPSCAALSSL